MTIHTTALLTAITLCLAPFACTVEDGTDEPINDASLLEEAAEDNDLALVGYLECQEESNDCSSEEEELVEALQHYELVNGDNDFRAIAIAECGPGRPYAICQAPGTCTATDFVGCVCMNNGALTVVASCS